MSDPVSSPLRRYRRRILGWGSLGVVVLCAVAAPVFLRSVERDLERRVPSELAERGFVGVSAAFSGQDGVLRCAAPLAEPEDAIDAAIDVWGVRAIELDRSCRVGGPPAAVIDDVTTTSPDETVSDPSIPPDTTAAPDAASPFDSIMDVVTSGPQFSILASLIAETDLVDTLATDGPTASALAELVAAMPPHLVSGESGIDGAELYTAGVFVDDEARIEFLAVADFLSADVELARRPTASAAGAAALEIELNAFVADNPRAQTVLAALAARGVPAGDLTAVGLGSTRPIVVGETEDKVASRRIEFRVTTDPGA